MILSQISLEKMLAERYSHGKQRFTYRDIASFTGIHYAPGDFRDANARIRANEYLEQMSRNGFLKLNVIGKKEGAVVYNGAFLPKMEFLCRQFGLPTCTSRENALFEALKETEFQSGPVYDLVQDTLTRIESGGGYDARLFGNDFEDLPEILAGADAVLSNTDETYIRNLSKKIYNDSKRLAYLRPGVEKFVKACADKNILDEYKELSEAGITKSIFPLYGVIPLPYPIMFEADMTFETDRGRIHTYGYPSCVMSNISSAYDKALLINDTLVTIENRTTYDDFREEGVGKFYTGGFPGFAEKKLLARIYADNPEKEYFHWGDIDVGGFRIFHNISKLIPTLKPLHMGPETLLRYKEEGLTTPLTPKDRELLRSMQDDKLFSATISLMLSKNMKMEQEAVYAMKKS